MMKIHPLFTLLLLAVLVLSACSPAPTAAPTGTAPGLRDTPTTEVEELPATPAPTTTPLPPGGWLEITVPSPVEDKEACVTTIPFIIAGVGTDAVVEGVGEVSCSFEGVPLAAIDESYVFRVELTYDVTLSGGVLPVTTDTPSGILDVSMTIDGQTVQTYVSLPENVRNACPLEQPCVTERAETLSLPFTFEDQIQYNSLWQVILHLE